MLYQSLCLLLYVQPPPPGLAPNAAQVAAAQGQGVVMSQRKTDALFGSDGGYTLY